MLRTFLSVAAAALLISVILFTPASSADSGEASIPSGEHRAWAIDEDQPFTLSYDISSEANATLNVIVVSADEYGKYQDGLAYSYIAQASHINTTAASADVSMDAGSYYLVVEDRRSDGNVSVSISYDINAMTPSTGSGNLVTILEAGVVVISALIVIILLDVLAKKRR